VGEFGLLAKTSCRNYVRVLIQPYHHDLKPKMLSEFSGAIDKLELRPRNKEKELDKDFLCNVDPCLLLWPYIIYQLSHFR
jgi:hypothetical protein